MFACDNKSFVLGKLHQLSGPLFIIAEAETVQYGGYGTDIGIEAVNSRNKKQKKHFETIERERGQLGSYSRCCRLMRLKILGSNLNEVLFESVRYKKPFKSISGTATFLQTATHLTAKFTTFILFCGNLCLKF